MNQDLVVTDEMPFVTSYNPSPCSVHIMIMYIPIYPVYYELLVQVILRYNIPVCLCSSAIDSL